MKFRIASAQYPITYHENFLSWKMHLKDWVERAKNGGADLCLFPEYGSMELVSLFNQNIQQSLTLQVQEISKIKNDILETYSDLASKFSIHIVASSLPILENGIINNRAYVFSNLGQLLGSQNKFFMTRFEDENWGVQKPKDFELLLFCHDEIKFGVQICYDIEFPLGATELARAGANLILAPSCTEKIHGSTRVHTGAKARAQELQCYTVVSQTVGNASWSLAVDENYGQAVVYTPADLNFPQDGVLELMKPQVEGWLFCELDFDLISKVRTSGQVLNFKDTMRQKIHFESPIQVKEVHF